MAYNLADKIAQAAKTGPNMTEAQAGGGDFTPPAQGTAQARLVGYFEVGIHEGDDFNNPGKKKDKNMVQLVFELSGPNHQPANGQPLRIVVEEQLALSDRANFFKLFGKMNYAGKATHMAQLLGEPFLVKVYHKKSADGKRTYATLKGTNKTEPVGDGYAVTGPFYDDPLSGKQVVITVVPPSTQPKAFIWDVADKEMWDSIFIEGEYSERKDAEGKVTSPAKTKNVIQGKIMAAKNWNTHPLHAILQAGGAMPDIPDAETPERSTPENAAAADPLASIG